MRLVAPGCYGKLPGSGEFIRLNVTESRAQALDGQAAPLVRTLQAAPDLQPVFQRAQSACCVQSEATQAWRVAVWFPSADRVGRSYPLVVGADFDGTHPAPDACEQLAVGLVFAGRVVHAVGTREPGSAAELDELLTGLPLEVDVVAECERMVEVMRSLSAGRFWSGCLGDGEADLRDRAVRVLLDPGADAVDAWRFAPTPTAAHFLFWTLLHERLHGSPPAALVLQAVVDERPPALALLPRRRDERLLAALLWPGIVEPGAGRRLATPLSPPAGAASPVPGTALAAGASLEDLLHHLVSAGTALRRRTVP